jgi:chromate transporter
MDSTAVDFAVPTAARSHHPTFVEAVWVWARVAALSFGGPAGQIAVMHRILVEEKRWIGEARFLHALNYCMLLPGPEAQQLAVYVGSWPVLMIGLAPPYRAREPTLPLAAGSGFGPARNLGA